MVFNAIFNNILLFSDLQAREGEVNQQKEADFVASRNL
jgi:hypothetical protein